MTYHCTIEASHIVGSLNLYIYILYIYIYIYNNIYIYIMTDFVLSWFSVINYIRCLQKLSISCPLAAPTISVAITTVVSCFHLRVQTFHQKDDKTSTWSTHGIASPTILTSLLIESTSHRLDFVQPVLNTFLCIIIVCCQVSRCTRFLY